jgi:uncharacterized protein
MDCFYTEGLRFECTGCRYCCGVEPGYVFITVEDLARLCDYTGLNSDEFLKKYCRKVSMGSISYVSLQEKKDFDCIFLTDKGCGVYPARPIQCSVYPFWDSIIKDRGSWEIEKESCPGIGKGRLYTEEEIEKYLVLRAGESPIIV